MGSEEIALLTVKTNPEKTGHLSLTWDIRQCSLLDVGCLFGGDSPALLTLCLGVGVRVAFGSAASGLPFTPFVSSNTSLNADFGQVPNRVNGAPLYSNGPFSIGSTHVRFRYRPVANMAMSLPGLLRGPGLFRPDLAVWKEWKFGDLSPLGIVLYSVPGGGT